jgi:hypothetical protein
LAAGAVDAAVAAVAGADAVVEGGGAVVAVEGGVDVDGCCGDGAAGEADLAFVVVAA